MGSVRLSHVSKQYEQGAMVLDDLSLEVRDGEFLVLVGPSGCGKSTTLRLVAGLEDPTSGTIEIGGRTVNDTPPKDRDIAMVFQNYALYPHMSVRENLAFGLTMRRYAKEEIAARVEEAAALLSIQELLPRKPKELSGGQRQRVALGRALVRRPAVFLFDEPLSNLDANLRAQMRAEISRLHRRLGATMIYVTHDQVEAMSMGDRIVVMHGGVVQQIDTPMAIYDAPANRFVAGFIGSPTMNFFEGRITGEGVGEFEEATGAFRIPLGARHAGRSHDLGKVVLGVRPEHIGLSPGSGAPIEAVADVTEPVGNEMFVHFTVGTTASRSICRVPSGPPPEIGRSCRLHVDTSRLHLFDPVTGLRL